MTAVGLLTVPRRWAFLPLLVGACYMSYGQGVSLGPFSLTVIRMLILVGVIRVFVRGERIEGGLNTIDKFLLLWAFIAVISSIGHKPIPNPWVFRLGLVYNTLGAYFLIRVFLRSEEDIRRVILMVAVTLAPLAIEMLSEHLTRKNMFSILGGVPENPVLRQERLRAQGPFMHAILAGNVGALCLPLMFAIWKRYRIVAGIGIGACLTMVVASSSSGPILSALFACVAVYLWKYRLYTKHMRYAIVGVYVLLELVMKAPAYYILGRIDLTGGSTGWHRARLMESAFEHLDEWWLFGADFTRHWMVSGVSWSPDHSDITNHYLSYGVVGGFPLMAVFIVILIRCFSQAGKCMQGLRLDGGNEKAEFLVWVLGASLVAHAASMISVSYFDQSFLFLYLIIACINSISGFRSV